MFYSDFFPLLFWNLSQAVPARECVCIPVVLLNQTGLQHSILFLDSRLPFLSCKKYSSASGWQAISFYKCVRPRFFHLSLPPSPFMPCCIQSLLGGKGRGVRILIHALDFSIHRSLASPGSFIFCARLLTQLRLLSVMGELLGWIELEGWEGEMALGLHWFHRRAPPKRTDVAVAALLRNTLSLYAKLSIGNKMTPGDAIQDLPAVNLYRSDGFWK